MDHLKDLIPTGKADLERARAAVSASYPEVAPILGELIGWLRDGNWPVARILAPFLASLGAPLVPHIRDVLISDDDVWKYWVISILVDALPKADAAQLRPELERLCHAPGPHEAAEELDEQARKILQKFGWLRGEPAKRQLD
ncbi:DUF5071 domain-containing protein [Bradyrhizobium sp. CCBAU 53340]|uniref:DUF5071 domain-containing protein n=1 Tax=Bradyrhizobium sp. CCBAU 53340 TaxID=1325112 RepID=UPI00188C9644|nr:DUF5071 domain-containing protein [Bradyrhizobium sp. CCBAU 53340]QOZ46842.1 DUF5071 domain-containing protein [Bradyrhizobium sp. CCBAU 53340]